MSGTDTASCLRACYAVSGTDIAYGTSCLRACYVMPGTDIGMVLPEDILSPVLVPAAPSAHDW
eukprot:715700-Rhodomonas_salina.1